MTELGGRLRILGTAVYDRFAEQICALDPLCWDTWVFKWEYMGHAWGQVAWTSCFPPGWKTKTSSSHFGSKKRKIIIEKKKEIKLINADKIPFNVNQTSLMLLMAAPGLSPARGIGGCPWDDAVDGRRTGHGVVVSSIGGRLGHRLS